MTSSRITSRILGGLIACVAALSLSVAPASAGTANQGLPGAWRHNPLGGMPWGIYRGKIDGVYPAYASSHGRNRQLLAKIALKPLTIWTGAWFGDNFAHTLAQQIIGDSTQGNPDALTQVAVFRLDPWEGQACPGSWSGADQASYRSWINGFASGIGSSRMAVIMQPDLPFALCAPSQVPVQLVNYGTQTLNALPHTTVYIDIGAAEWAKVPQAVSLLEAAGIRHARGFALDVTQYGSTGLELAYGAQIVHALAAAGIPGKHFVINTDQNGTPFLAGQYPGDANEARACASTRDHLCVALGIPPTTDVANPRWGLSAASRAIARHYADAYLWAGRPWVDNNTGVFVYSKALELAASSPF